MANAFGNREAAELFEAITDAVLTVNRDWQITYINRHGAAIADLTPDQIIGRILWEAFPQMVGSPLESNYRQAMESRKPLHFTAKGSVRDLWYTISVYPIEDGILIYTVNDDETQKSAIQEQKLLEENLRHKSLLDAIFEADPAALAVLAGPELRFVFANPAYRYLVPDPFRDPLGCTYEEVWHAKNPYDSRRQLRRVLATGQPFQAPSIEISYPDWTRRTFNLQARRIDWGGEAAVLLILWDITELKEAEKQQRAAALFPEQNPHPVLRLSSDGCILYTNPASQRLLPEYRQGEQIPEFWQVIARDAYESRESRIVDFEHGDRVFAFHVVPIPGAGYVNLYVRDITEHKKLLGALQESEKQYRELVQYAPVGIYKVDFRQKRFLSINDAVCQLSGYSREELFAMGPFALLDEDSRILFQKRIQKWLAGEEPDRNVEYRVRMKDGRMVDAKLDVSFTSDEAGRPIGATVVATDITALKQTERAQREALKAAEESEKAIEASEIRYRLLAEQSPDAILVNLENRFVYANRAAAQLLGAGSPKDLIGLSPIDVLDPEFHEVIRKRIERILTRPGSNPLKEVRWRRLDGTAVDVEASSLAIRWEGKPAIQIVVRDITERKKMEQALLVSEEKFSNAFTFSPNAVTITRLSDGKIIEGNESAYELFGYARDEVVGKTTFELDIWADPADRVRLVKELASKGFVKNLEFILKKKNQTQAIVDLSASLITIDGQQCFLSSFIDITARKQAEDAFRESRMLLQAVIESTQDPVYVKDRQSRILLANQALAHLVGKPIEDIVGKTDSEYYDNADIGRALRENDLKVMESEASLSVEETVMAKEGWRTFLSAKVPYRDPEGQVIGIIGISRDITERKRAERALRESEERYRGIVETAEEGIGIHEPDGTITYVNRRLAEMLGYPPDEIVGRSSLDFLDDGQRQAVIQARESLKEKGSFKAERKLRRKDGSFLWTLCNVSPRRDGSGNFLGYLALHTDITERKKMEESLRESEEKYRLLFENMTEMFQILEPICDEKGRVVDFRYIEVNRATEKLTGKKRNEIEGKTAKQLWGTVEGYWLEMLGKVLKTGEPDHMENYSKELDTYYDLYAWKLDEHSVAIVFSDITKRKRSEEEVRSQLVHIELQRRLLEQREQERLKIARDLHDGPVQELTGAHYALEGVLNTTQDEALAQGLQAIRETLKSQVAELRAYAGELRPPTLSKFGLAKAIRSHLDTFQEKHPEIQVQFEGAQDGELIPEEKRLGLFRIYQETITNIAKHAHASLVTIRLEKTQKQVALDIRDNGVGFDIPKDWLELARAGHLGLVGMRERAEAVGGELQIESSPRQGTCIRLRVPLLINMNTG